MGAEIEDHQHPLVLLNNAEVLVPVTEIPLIRCCTAMATEHIHNQDESNINLPMILLDHREQVVGLRIGILQQIRAASIAR